MASLDLTSASLDLTSLAALLISALLLMLLWARRRTGRSATKATDESLDTVQDWPPQAVRVLTLSERKAYDLLRKAVPNRLVLAQVPLARFITVPTKNSYGDWLNRAGRLSVDLLVCDQSSRVIAAIDIRTTEDSARTRKRHTRMGEVLRKAGVVVHVWKAEALPSVSEIRSAFAPLPAAAAGAAAALAGDGLTPSPTKLLGSNHLLPVPEAIEMLAAGDEAAANGLLLDPVSSAYFDDLDAFGSQAQAQR